MKRFGENATICRKKGAFGTFNDRCPINLPRERVNPVWFHMSVNGLPFGKVYIKALLVTISPHLSTNILITTTVNTTIINTTISTTTTLHTNIKMGFSSFVKHFQHKSTSEDFLSTTYSTPASSRPGSFVFEDATISSSPNHKYLSDPMRHSNVPDYLGGFHDPISRHYMQSSDCTNTGA